jgi:hypothetical protein
MVRFSYAQNKVQEPCSAVYGLEHSNLDKETQRAGGGAFVLELANSLCENLYTFLS